MGACCCATATEEEVRPILNNKTEVIRQRGTKKEKQNGYCVPEQRPTIPNDIFNSCDAKPEVKAYIEELAKATKEHRSNSEFRDRMIEDCDEMSGSDFEKGTNESYTIDSLATETKISPSLPSGRGNENCVPEQQPTIPNDILNILKECCDAKPEVLARVLFFLSKKESENKAESYIQCIRALNYKADEVNAYIDQLAKATKEQRSNNEFRDRMKEAWDMMSGSDFETGTNESDFIDSLATETKASHSLPSGKGKENRWPQFGRKDSRYSSELFCFMFALCELPNKQFSSTKEIIESVATAGSVVTYDQQAKQLIKVALVTVRLSLEILSNIKRWWLGDISGQRCVKNITESILGLAAGAAGAYGGGIAGEMIGNYFAGPAGAVVGYHIGAMLCKTTAANAISMLSERLTEWFFDLPKSEALENAYRFLMVNSTASNGEINSKYRILCLAHHPDKGGDRQQWDKLQYSMAIIREARANE